MISFLRFVRPFVDSWANPTPPKLPKRRELRMEMFLLVPLQKRGLNLASEICQFRTAPEGARTWEFIRSLRQSIRLKPDTKLPKTAPSVNLSMAPKTYIPTAMATEMKAHYLCSATECRKELQNAGVTVHQDLSLAELRVTLREHRLKTGLLIKRSAGSDTMAMIKRANKKELEVMAGQRELKVPEKASVGELRLALRQAVIDNSSGETQMEIGKHQGATFMEILNSDYQYARWAVQEIQTSDNPDWRLIQFARWVSRMEKQEEPVEVTPLTTSGVKEMFQASQNQPQAGTPLAYAATVVKPNQNIHLAQPGKKKVQVPLDTEVPTAAQRGSSSSETGEIKEMLQQMMLKMHTMESELKEVKEGHSSHSGTSKTRKTSQGYEKIKLDAEEL